MAKHDLKEEIELMLKLVPGSWRLRFSRPILMQAESREELKLKLGGLEAGEVICVG